jgi:Tfp pilus assembly protein PilX
MRLETLRSTTRREEGLALLVTVFVLLVMSAVGIMALDRARDEGTLSGRARSKTAASAIAESGVAFLLRTQIPAARAAGLTPGDVVMSQPQFMSDQQGFATAVRTGTADNAVPAAPERVGTGRLSGSSLNLNQVGSFMYGIYRTAVVATDQGGGNAQIQVQFIAMDGGQ